MVPASVINDFELFYRKQPNGLAYNIMVIR